MIADVQQSGWAQAEIRSLEERLCRRQRDDPGSRGFTRAGFRKLIARLHEERAVYEGAAESQPSEAN